MKTLLFVTMALSLAASAAAATASSPDQHLATSVPACISKSSPILDNHYGYDDRVCPTKLIEGRAAKVDQGSSSAQ
jgi:hypothetical protein